MRPIKFRVWEHSRRCFLSADNNAIFIDGHGFVQVFKQQPNLYWADGSVDIMQFTGLLDKNGKEIYEGDVVKIIYLPYRNHSCVSQKEKIEPVKWGHYGDEEYVSRIECWMAGHEPLSDLGGLWGSGLHQYEVIGNIYSNPELVSQ